MAPELDWPELPDELELPPFPELDVPDELDAPEAPASEEPLLLPEFPP